jgi:GNAT superfamily N-acetyltransferase
MTLRLRPFDQEYGTLLALADAAVPFDHEGNRQWLGHRRRFDSARRTRRHYLVEETGAGPAAATTAGEPLGYGAVEQDATDQRRFRLFLVADPERLGGVGDYLMKRLLADLEELGAGTVWAREYGRDTALLAFLGRWGFQVVGRVWDLRRSLATEEGPVPAPIVGPVVITTLAAELRRVEDALPRLHRAVERLLAQAAGDRPPAPVPYDQFVRWLGQPGLSPEAYFLARHGETYVGASVWQQDPKRAVLLHQQFTAVQAAYQPWDVARALRRAAMAYARQKGYEALVAHVPEAETETLSALEALGFQRRFAYVTLERRGTASPVS